MGLGLTRLIHSSQFPVHVRSTKEYGVILPGLSLGDATGSLMTASTNDLPTVHREPD